MELVIKPSQSLHGTVRCPESKSYTHRAIILASLSKGRSIIHNPLLSEDIMATINACKKIGAEITDRDGSLEIEGVFGEPRTPLDAIDARNSGTTLRFMTAVSSLCNGQVTLTGDESLRQRPMEPLLDALEQLGVTTFSSGGKAPVKVQGPMKGGHCIIPGDISSQFISGLLIATPLALGETSINLSTPLQSRPYVDITLEMIERFNGRVERGCDAFRVTGRQIYNAVDYEIEGDYSSAAFPLVAAALTNSEVTVTNLLKRSKQGDRKIVDILREMGANVRIEGESVTVRETGHYGDIDRIDIDLGDTPDLVPIVAVLASLARGTTKIRNVGHCRFKESDRLKAISTELSRMGAKIKEGKDNLEIRGVETLKGCSLHGWNDHRIVMALAVAALRAEGETRIDTAESVSISYPGFVSDMTNLGASMETRN